MFHGLDVLTVIDPCFTTVEEGGDADSLVDTDFSMEM